MYGLNQEHFVATIQCESGFDAQTQSFVLDPDGPNGHEDSWGIVQIHLPAHPDITREQAQDAAFSLQWMAQQWRDDKAYMWSCWRMLYGTA